MADRTETLFTVARGKDVLTGLRTSARAAKFDLAGIETAMRTAGLEPDVHLATVTRTTTISEPEPYVEQPVAVDEPAEPDVEQEQAEDPEPKKSGRRG